MTRGSHGHERRRRKGANFFLTAVAVAIAIFVAAEIVQHFWPAGRAPRMAHNQSPATVTSAIPQSAASLSGFSLVLIRCQRTKGCPYYDLHVKSDTLTYSGVRDVAKRGNVEVPLAKDRKRKLLQLVRKSRFFSLGDSYDLGSPACNAKRTDAPTFTVGVTLNGETKVVRANQACSNVPARLSALAAGIDQTARSVRWTGAGASASAPDALTGSRGA